VLPFLLVASLLLPGCPLKDDYYLEADGLGGAPSSGGMSEGGAVSNSGRGNTSEAGSTSDTGGSPGAGGTSGAANRGGEGGDDGSGTAGCVSVTNQGHEYAFCLETLTQAAARADCNARGMTLAVIEDQAENSWIAQTLSSQYEGDSTRAFIGANDSTTEGEWRWADGVAFWSGGANGDPVNRRYTNWVDGEPNNESPIPGAADCLTMYLSDGTWGDLSCDAELPYVCEPR